MLEMLEEPGKSKTEKQGGYFSRLQSRRAQRLYSQSEDVQNWALLDPHKFLLYQEVQTGEFLQTQRNTVPSQAVLSNSVFLNRLCSSDDF